MGVFELIKSLPVILQTLLELKKMWDQFIEQKDRRATMSQFADALKTARETKDTKPVEDILRNIVNGDH